MEKLVAKLQQAYPSIAFIEGDVPHWSPEKRQISYRMDDSKRSIWTVLHELGHALEAHTSYATDIDLLKKEVDAWTRAKQIGSDYDIIIETDYIEYCLDSYRDWLYKRSTCPECKLQGVQELEGVYACLNCSSIWRVGSNRFCRPYRLQKAQKAYKNPER